MSMPAALAASDAALERLRCWLAGGPPVWKVWDEEAEGVGIVGVWADRRTSPETTGTSTAIMGAVGVITIVMLRWNGRSLSSWCREN